jgi:hypothetical protein
VSDFYILDWGLMAENNPLTLKSAIPNLNSEIFLPTTKEKRPNTKYRFSCHFGGYKSTSDFCFCHFWLKIKYRAKNWPDCNVFWQKYPSMIY